MGAPTSAGTSAAPSISQAGAPKVLLVDDHGDRRQLMSYLVGLCGDDVSVVGYADGPSEALSALERTGATVALVEMQVHTALETIRSLRVHHPDLRIIVCSFNDDSRTKRSALSTGADAFLIKPISTRDLGPYLRDPLPN